MEQGDFLEWLKTVKKQELPVNDGGFLIPKTTTTKRPGLLGWLARLINHPYGFIVTDIDGFLSHANCRCALIDEGKSS